MPGGWQFCNYCWLDAGDALTDLDTDKKAPVTKEKSGPEPIIVPLVLKMAEFDHKVVLHLSLFQKHFLPVFLFPLCFYGALCVFLVWVVSHVKRFNLRLLKILSSSSMALWSSKRWEECWIFVFRTWLS